MSNQFSLLKKRRFGPFFITQFLGAFNDNVYKNALIILLAFQSIHYSNLPTTTLINLAGALFTLPFFIFSATCGQIADKYEKSRLIRFTKLLEVAITLIIGFAFYLDNLFLLMTALFLLGAQATLFGPVKYSILPQKLKYEELVGGNGLVGMGTFVAIITGAITGGFLISVPHYGKAIVTLTIFLLAIMGWLFSRSIPIATPADEKIHIDWNLFRSTWQNMKFAKKNKSVFLAILGISWFWFYGTFMFYQAPYYTETYLGGDEHVATLVIAFFSIGIGIGSLLCERLSQRAIEIGLVPLAAIGISVFTADLYHLKHHPAVLTHQSVSYFFSQAKHLWIMFNLIMIGVFGGLYTVPLYAFIQDRSEVKQRARIIASNNILSALFMVFAAIFVITLLHVGLTIPQLFLVVAILNACVTLYIFSIVPEFVVRLCVWLISNLLYRLKITGLNHLPAKGGAIFACNHVSFMDVSIVAGASRRPIRFLMDHQLFNTPILGTISRLAKAIPIAPGKENDHLKQKALNEAVKTLKEGGIIGIFPEGYITRDGELSPFRKGIEDLLQRYPVPVVPMALQGLWGSFFSRKYGKAMSSFPRRFWSKVHLRIGEPIPPEDFSIEKLQAKVEALLKED